MTTHPELDKNTATANMTSPKIVVAFKLNALKKIITLKEVMEAKRPEKFQFKNIYHYALTL